MSAPSVHAGCVLIGPVGILIRGHSASGKSALADLLIQAARRSGNLGLLVSDDRTLLRRSAHNLIAAAPASISGLMEVRGFGVVSEDCEAEAVVRLVVDLRPREDVPRLPDEPVRQIELEGVHVAVVLAPIGDLWGGFRVVQRALLHLFPKGSGYL